MQKVTERLIGSKQDESAKARLLDDDEVDEMLEEQRLKDEEAKVK